MRFFGNHLIANVELPVGLIVEHFKSRDLTHLAPA